MNEELIQVFKDYVATANNPQYGGNWDIINSKFPELSGYDKQLLKDYVATANNSSYGGDWNIINSKFPEFFGDVKKKEPSVSTSQEGAMAPATEAGSLESQESAPVLDFTKLRQEQQAKQFGELPAQPKTESMLSPEAKAQVDERIKRGEVQVAPVVKAEEPVGVSEKLAYLWDSGVNVLSDLSQNVRQSVMGLDRASVYEFVDKNRDQFPELYNEYTKLKGQGASDADAAYGAYLEMARLDPTLETRVNSFVRSKGKEKLREEIGSDLSKEQREKLSSDLVTSSLGGLVESTPAMLSSGSTYGLSFFDMAYRGAEDMLAQEFEQNPDLKLTAAQQEEYKLTSGAIMAVIEKAGLSNAIKGNPLIRRALTARVLSSMAGLGKEAGSEAFEKVVKKELGTLARVSKGIGSGFVAEAETGALQELAQNGLNYYVNETSGKTVFDGKSATELVKDVLRAGIAEGIGGGFIGGVVNVFSNPDAITEEEFAKAKAFASEVDINKVQQHLAEEMSAGKMSKDDASRILNNINEFRAVANSVPDDVSSEAQAKIFKLIKEKQDISKSVAGKDDAIQAVAKEQIKAIDENIKELYVTSKAQPQDAIQEKATDEAAVVPDEIQSLNDDEIVTFTVESLDQVPDEFRDRAEKKDGTEIEIRKTILGLPIGEKTTKVVNEGYTYTLTGKEAKDYAIQKQATDEGVLRPEQPEVGLQEVVEGDQEPQVASEEVVVQEEVSPAVQEIEARRDKEIEERGLNRLFPLTVDDTAEGRRIQEEREQLDADLQELNARYDAEIAALGETTPVAQPAVKDAVVQEEVVADVEEGAAEVDAQELADLAADMQATAPARRERLERVAERARTAVSKILPDVKIIVHDTQEAYRAATTFEGEATYNNDTKTVHINGTKATPAAVAHEVFHAVFLDKVKTDAKAQAVAKKMVESLKRVLGEDSEAYQYLDEFSKDYDVNFQNEEKLAEMVAVLSELYSGVNDIGLSPSAVQSVKNAIKKFITDLAKLFNIPMATTLTDADVLAVLNTIAQKAVTGEVITEADVQTIDRVAAEDITPVEQSEVQMRERKGLITITEREAQKYARIGINDARVAQAMEDLGLAGVKFTKGDVETAISKAFDKAIDDLKADMYNGQPAVITQDSPAITRAIEAEIAALEEQGASLSRIESAKQMINDPRTRNSYIKEYQDAQAETLQQWVSYLEQSDYDPAFKFLMLDAVVTNNYDLKTQKYVKRDNKTIRNITPFDAGTLAELYGMTDSKELLKTYAEIQADNASRVVKANMMKSTKDGKWLKFAGGDNVSESEREVNATALSQLVQDTYWCTKTNAKSQLDGGDFYVYVTEGTDMRPIPRIAVRMNGSDVGELRGNASSKQDLEPEMLPVAEKFLKEEIPGGSGQKWLDHIAFNKKAKAFAESIDGLTLSMNMINEFAKLSSESAKYNVDYGRNGFIERIEESIKAKVKAGDVTSELDGVIETSLGDANPKTKIFVGNAGRGFFDGLQNVEIVIGNVNIGGTEIAPRSLRLITGDLNLGDNIQSLSNIETVGGEIYFGQSFNTLEDLGKIEVINGAFSLPTRIKTFDYLKTINSSLDISSTSFLESLGSLEVINGGLYAISSDLNSLGSLKSVSGYAVLPRGVKKIDGVSFGDSLTVFDGVEIINVKTIPRDFVVSEVPGMESKHSATGSIEEIGGTALLHDSSSKSIGNIKRVGGGVTLPSNIKSLENLSHVNGNIGIYGGMIKSIDNLEYVGGDLTVYAREISSLGSVKHVGGNIEFSMLSAVEDLGKLEYVGGLVKLAWSIKDIGALSSVGERWFSGFKNNTGEDVNIAAFAARYVQESRLDGSPIAEKVYELALKQASKHFGVELPPAPRQRKDSDAAYENWKNGPKSVAQEIGYKYNMNHKGYTPSNIVKQHFKNEVERLSSRLSIRSTITGSGYYMTLDGKFFNPYLKVIGGQDSGPNGLRQRMGQPNENIFDIVTMARQKGYTDKTIEIYLKQEGFAAEDIKDAMAVNSNIDGAQVPQEFGNVTGGMAQGQTLFDEIKAKLTKMAADGASMMDIRIEAQTLLMDSDVYKAQSVEVKAQLRLSLDATIGTKAADRAFRQEFKQLRAMLADRKKARRELETIKRTMRGFIRKNLPQGEYSKAEVVKLLKAIVDANVDSLSLVMQQVQNYVTEFKVRNLESQIKKLLATKTTKVDSGRVMGITTIDVQEDLATLNDMLIDDGMSEDNKQDLFSKQVNEYQTLNSKYDLTDEDIRRLQLLEIANAYNAAMLLDDNNPVKVESLTMARDRINIMITVGRSEFNANQKIKHQQQKKNVVDVLEAITGNPVPEDITDDDKLDGYVRNEKTTEANVNALKSRISKVLGAFAKNPLKAYFNRGASLSNLLGQITANLTDMFGGPVNEMVYDKIKQSDIELARRELVVGKMIESKLKEIYGEKYNIQVQRNKIPQIIDVFKKERAVEARRLTEEMKTASPGRKSEIMLELTKMRVFDPLSQNKIYYLYNQFKSQENRAGLETNYGEDYVEYLNELFENHLDPKVREWADWQVDVLFPELYDAYNPVYVEIFKTNMPWTANYGGRVYRKGDSQTDMAIPLMNENGKFATIQTPSSTKARKQNKNAIQEMDGDLVLDSYIKDMEYFRAYGVTIRDISRIFKNEAVRIAVKKAAGEDVLDLIDGYIKIVGTNGMSVGITMKQGILDSIDSNLGISYMAGALNQLIKQATSAFLFAPRIGINNWIAYTAKAAPNLGTLWNEFIDNAPRIVKRYNPKEMAKIMGGYDSNVSRKLAEETGVGNNRRALKALDAASQAINALMWPVIRGDKYSAMAGAMGNYLYYKDMYMEKNPGAANEQAIKFAADKVSTEIEQILGSSSRIDRDSYQNSGSTLFRALSFLSNSPKAMIRNVIPAYSGLFKKVASFDRTAGQGTLKQNLETVLMFQVFVPVLFKWAAIGLPGLWREWRDEDDEELGAAAILGPFEALLIVGPLLTLVKERILDKPWADDMPTIPIYDLTEDLVRQVNKIIKAQTSDSISNAEADELREDALLNISYIIAGGFGIPAKNIDRMIRNIGEVIDGNEKPGEALLRLFNYSDYTIEGPEDK